MKSRMCKCENCRILYRITEIKQVTPYKNLRTHNNEELNSVLEKLCPACLIDKVLILERVLREKVARNG